MKYGYTLQREQSLNCHVNSTDFTPPETEISNMALSEHVNLWAHVAVGYRGKRNAWY